MKCQYCGTENEADAKFCVGCGKNLAQGISFINNGNNREDHMDPDVQESVDTGNGLPPSMIQTARSAGESNSVLSQRFAIAAIVFIGVVVIVWIMNTAVKNTDQKSSGDSRDASSYYSGQDTTYNTDDYSYDNYESGTTANQSDIGGSTNNADAYTYNWDDDSDDEDYESYEEEYDDDDSYIIADSDSRKLTKSDVTGLSKEELRIARNEIYARHGRLFQDAELQSYFDSQDWYDGYIDPEEFVDSEELSALERRNAKFIQKFE